MEYISHTFKDYPCEIRFGGFLEKNRRQVYVTVNTPHGQWMSDLHVSNELLELEENAKDYLCATAVSAYERKFKDTAE